MASDDHLLPQLPEEIIIFHILTRLPTKSLLRFRSVCKSWNSATSEASFVSLHRHSHPKSNSHILISAWEDKSSQQHFLSAPIHGGPRPPPPTHLLSLSLRHSLSVKCVNGLLCLHYPNHHYSDRPDFPAYIFNPRTRELVALPLNEPANQKVKVLYHFGYDPLSDDYKVLQICRFIDTNLEMSENSITFKVLSLGSAEWRQINPSLPFFCSSYGALFSSSCVSNGGIHWVVRRKKCVLAFNLHDEQFSLIPFPEPFDNKVPAAKIEEEYLVEVGRSLGLLLKTSCLKKKMEMWVLKNYQKQEWVKEASFAYDMSDNDCRLPRVDPLPLGTANEGDEEILLFKPVGKLEELGRLLYYDMERRRFRGAEIGGLSQWLSSNDVRDYSFDVFEENIMTLSFVLC